METLTDAERTLACVAILLALVLATPMALSHADRWFCATWQKLRS
jgi:hypothetical protein